jgi:S-sulfo-L-cysteine synthase (O-acetyl-L-serine-dependent)
LKGKKNMQTVFSFPKTHIRTTPSPVGLESLVGNTPMLKLRRVTQGLAPRVEVYAKAEWFNPGGSIKDRPALNILRSALEDGLLADGKRLLDSTSGNMGISYAHLELFSVFRLRWSCHPTPAQNVLPSCAP